MIKYDLTQLETRGYAIIPNFISTEKVLECQSLYNSLELSDDNKNYTLKKSNNPIITEVLDLLKEINLQTSMLTNAVNNRVLYFDNNLINFGWHQDHETYFRYQDSYHSLNLWIPIIKPELDTSGLKVVPYDSLNSKIPFVTETQIRGKGAKRFGIQSDSTTKMYDDENGTETILPLSLDDICEIPDVGPGDLILMREDTIHMTQTITNHRVAMSVRCINYNTIITAEKLYSGSSLKKSMINNNRSSYLDLINALNSTPSVVASEAIEKFNENFTCL